MTSSKLNTFYKHLAYLALGTLLMGPPLASAASLSISQIPLFITIALPPNITVLLDDSGSMEWGHVPDGLGNFAAAAEVFVVPSTSVTATCTGTVSHSRCSTNTYNYTCPSTYTLNGPTSGSSSNPSTSYCTQAGSYQYFSNGSVYQPDTFQYKSASFNPLSYNPALTYSPGNSDTGTPLTTSFTKAYVNPYNTSLGFVDLSQSYMATRDYDPSTSVSTLMGTTSSTTGITSSPNTFKCGGGTCVQDEVNDCQSFTTSGTCNSFANYIPTAAFYYTYTPTSATSIANGCGTHNYSVTVNHVTTHPLVVTTVDDSCYTKVVVSTTSGPGGTDERQNFANWFSFYRTRNLTTNTSANIAFTGLNSSYRVAWLDLNTCNDFSGSNCTGWDSTNYDNRIATFTSTHRQNFFDWLAHYPASGGTPLRAGLQSIGVYYSKAAGVTSPYAFNPQVTDSPEYVCRPNYAVIMTDGLWNDTNSPSPSVNNADGVAMTLPDGTAFAAKTYPYYDTTSSTLADVAFYYWAHNLRPDLGTSTSLQYMPDTNSATVTDTHNNTATLIPYWNPQNDPASWPHMVTFAVGLGLTSTLTTPSWGGSTYSGGYNNLVTSNIAWPVMSSNNPNNAYDLWHAALDSRGQFFSADSPADVQAAFNTIVNRIQGRVGSSSAVAVNSTHLNSNTFVYQAQFNSSNWTGDVLAYAINLDGSIATTPTWAASTNIPVPTSRNILTWNETLNSGAGGGTTFLWANLDTTEQTNLNTTLENQVDGNGSLRVNYLRGDQSDEQSNAGIFRIRSSIFGDIVNSDPQFVGTQDYGYDSSALTANSGAEGSTYDSFVAGKANRTDPFVLYVGGNDGMLHAINVCTTASCPAGHEIFDYVPRGVYPNLSALTDPLYTHEYYVDGSPISVDAYVSNAWKTLLVGTTGAGAQDVFLLDITDASNMTSSNVLWDYDGVHGAVSGTAYSSSGAGSTFNTLPDPDMGFTISEPTIVRMHDGNWYALFGNGYNSTNQQAVIYLYNINTKTLLKYSTGVGSTTSPNGMSSPSPTDYDGDRITDAIYAGDLAGNLWKLDVSSSSPANWHFVTYGNSVATPLFTGHDSSGNVQPITERPQVGLNSSGQVMVYFGTGTYFLTTDNSVGSTPPVQTFYGIIDDRGSAAADKVQGISNTDRSELLHQYIVTTTTISGTNYRINTSYVMTSSDKGWFVDLLTPPVPGTAQGERVVSDAVLDLGRIVFPTLIPQGNACQFGGESFLMELDANSGGALPFSPFDTNGDGLVNNQDMVTVTYTDPATGASVTATVAVAGLQASGIIKTPAIISAGQNQEKILGHSNATLTGVKEAGSDASKRISWQQLQ